MRRYEVWRWGKREIIYLSLHCHHLNYSCIKMGSVESCFNDTLIARDKVTRQCPQTTTFEEKGEPKQIRTEVPLVTSLALPLGQTGSHEFARSTLSLRRRPNTAPRFRFSPRFTSRRSDWLTVRILLFTFLIFPALLL